jgi:hypothetical protein
MIDGIVIGCLLGWFVALVSLYFFEVEIYNFMEELKTKVRRLLGLDSQ